ncbi:MAG: efflux RND transporter periplasmic adaptor subunit [Kordiimonadaceae bacterium]|nr:efflux RND transporter periplasmic adaptor subunit [Kordiimonadaceae bacterium]
MPRYFKNAPAIFAIAAVSIFGSVSALGQDQQFPPAQVEVVEAEVRMLAPQMEVSATVISLNDSRISAEIEGLLVWTAQVGAQVKKGDIIARIDGRLMEIGQRRAAANLARLKADMIFRTQEVTRIKELAKRNNTSQSRLQEVISRRAVLEQDILEAEAILERAQGDVDRTNIRAPFGGHIVERLAEIGEYQNIGSNVIRLVDTSSVEVSMAAPISIAPYLKAGAAVFATSGADKQALTIRTVVPVGDRISRMMEVRLSLGAGTWIVGSPVRVKLPKGIARNVVAVPRDTLILQGGRATIFKIGEDGKAQQIPIDLRGTVGFWVAAPDGISAGDKIVIRGGERLGPGQEVVVKN